MQGASRGSLARQASALDARRGSEGFEGLAGELYAVADLLDREPALRSTLADSGQSHAVREALVRQVLGGRVSELAIAVLVDVTGDRWSAEDDLVAAVESLAGQAAMSVAESAGTLDAVEEELFRFERAVDSSSELQMALTDPAQSPKVKAAIVADLLRDRSTDVTRQVLEHTVGHLHGRRIDSAIDALIDLAARQRGRMVAEVRVAAPLTDEQVRRLAAALSQMKGREVRLNVAVDPTVLGGVHVTVGDDVIDGTIATRMEQARRVVLG